MKISSDQKAIVRQNLLESAILLFTEKGFAGATMREISSRAGYSPGTIYSYFPTKERIYFAYFEMRQEQTFDEIDQIEGFEAFGFKESIQTYLELLLESFLPDREFVSGAFRAIMDSPMRSFSDLRPAREKFSDWVTSLIQQEDGDPEATPHALLSFFAHLIEDYKNLIIIHWLRDESEGFHRTSQLIDLSLDLLTSILKSGILPKTADILIFLLKGHLFGNADQLFRLMTPDLSEKQAAKTEKSKSNSRPKPASTTQASAKGKVSKRTSRK